MAGALLAVAAPPALRRSPVEKPNILFIMGDDIGWMQPSIYHQGLMVGETPNIDRIGHEGAKFMTYYAEQSCTAGRTAFFTGMHAAARRHDPAAIARQPVASCSPARRRSPSSCSTSATPPASSARTTWATTRRRCRRRTASRNSGVTSTTWTRCRASASPTSTRPRPSRPSCRRARTRRSRVSPIPGRGRSEDHAVHDAAAAGDRVQVLRRHRRRTRPAQTRVR